MKVVIFSGGTGSIALQTSLKEFNPNIQITNIINGYDDGKSTGVCREICNVLGASDIRKNHWIHIRTKNEQNRMEHEDFFNRRYNFNNLDEIEQELNNYHYYDSNMRLGFNEFKNSITEEHTSFQDFNLANIIYSGLFKLWGYEKTIEYFNRKFNLDDEILLTSFDNLILKAITNFGTILNSEAEITDYNKSDAIKKILFYNKNIQNFVEPKTNHKVLEKIDGADIIIISAGTLWSSIIPSLLPEICESLNNSKAKKFIIFNNENDKDIIDLTSIHIFNHYKNFLNLDDFNIIINLDANENLRQPINHKNTIYQNLGNYDGKHLPSRLARCIFMEIYKNIFKSKHLLFDFDDTLYSSNLPKISDENLQLINNLKNVGIVSGNSITHLVTNIKIDNEKFNVDIWSDYGSVLYKQKGKRITEMKKFEINEYEEEILTILESKSIPKDKIHYRMYSNDHRKPWEDSILCITIKPLHNRLQIKQSLEEIFQKNLLNLKVQIAGRSSVDIINNNVSKTNCLNNLDPKKDKRDITFIGNECLLGNDVEIANNCGYFYNVNSIYETNSILKLLNHDNLWNNFSCG